MIKNRLKYLDIASGIMITWLLFYHALYPMYEDNTSAAIPFLYFFMPWFFYKSGMMFHIKDAKLLFQKDFKRLIVVFIIWSIIGYIMMVLWNLLIGEGLTFKLLIKRPIRSLFLNCSIPMNSALWFIPILFAVRQLANGLLKRFKSYFVAICSLIFAITCLLINKHIAPYCLPIWISGTAWGMFYFVSAIVFRKLETKILIIIITTGLYIISLFTSIPSVYSSDNPELILNSLWYVSSLFSCICFNNFCKFIVYLYQKVAHNMDSKLICPIMTYIGQNSMSFYVVHYLICRVGFDLIAIYKEEWYANIQGFLIISLCYAIICPLVALCRNKYKKDIL